MNKPYPSYRAAILPIHKGTQRPLWSVMIPTYNCANYLRETLASVLEQDPGTEILIQEALNCSQSFKVWKQIVRILLKTGKHQIKKTFSAFAPLHVQQTKND